MGNRARNPDSFCLSADAGGGANYAKVVRYRERAKGAPPRAECARLMAIADNALSTLPYVSGEIVGHTRSIDDRRARSQ